MKKVIIVSLITAIIFVLFAVATSIYLAFSVVKPTTETINKQIIKDLSKVIRVPEGIPLPIYGFDETIYFWEMETIAKEVIGVRFKYTPAFGKNEDKIIATLEIAENGDPSIFNKVLSAIITDKQSLLASQDPKMANLSASKDAGYNSIDLAIKENTLQTTKITWEFGKENLSEELSNSYRKLNKYPMFMLRFLFGIPDLIIGLLRG